MAKALERILELVKEVLRLRHNVSVMLNRCQEREKRIGVLEEEVASRKVEVGVPKKCVAEEEEQAGGPERWWWREWWRWGMRMWLCQVWLVR